MSGWVQQDAPAGWQVQKNLYTGEERHREDRGPVAYHEWKAGKPPEKSEE